MLQSCIKLSKLDVIRINDTGASFQDVVVNIFFQAIAPWCEMHYSTPVGVEQADNLCMRTQQTSITI